MRIHQLIGPIQGTVMEDPLYESDYCMEFGESSALEPEAPFRYLNHSCHPNCALVEFEVDREDGTVGDPELWLEILTEIAPGEQMTIDYGWPARMAIPCDCGCPDCRGWIVAVEEQGQIDLANRFQCSSLSSSASAELRAESTRLLALKRTQRKHRRDLRRLYRLWEKWNRKFFAGKLTTPQIVLDRSGDSSPYGSCGPTAYRTARSRIRLRLSLLTGDHPRVLAGPRHARSRYRLVAEVLLHEMVHQWRREVVGDGDPAWRDHGPAFCRKCNEIGRRLGLIPVRSAQETGPQPALPSCAHWPHNARRKRDNGASRGTR